MSFLVIECSKCGTPQYIKKGQEGRVCPKCHFHINCKTIEPLGKASSEIEAQKLVQSMKIPNELSDRMVHLRQRLNLNGEKTATPYFLFNNIVTQLLGPFPNRIPLAILMKQAEEIGLEVSFVEKILANLESEGYLLKSDDVRGNSTIKFTPLPLDLGKIHIKRPDPNFGRAKSLSIVEDDKDGTDSA
jgi:hypothetical protein